MPLLQEAQPKRELLSSHDAIKQSEDVINSPLNQLTFPSLPNAGMFTPSQLLVASQTAALMAASGLGLQNPAFFHPGLFSAWTSSHAANSPPSSTTEKISSLDQLSPALKTRKHNLSHHNNNNNNNVVSSSNMEDIKVKAPRRKLPKKNGGNEEDLPISPPTSATSGSSPPSSSDITTVTNPSKDLSRDKQFTCGVCNRSFGYKHVLQNHERTHTGEKPFECPECHKRFTRDHHLKTHLRLHTGERPYHCEFCDRQFVQVANLRRHLRVHTGERPYACQYCTARFSDSNQLKAHVLIHKGEKPFECRQCSGKFRRRHHLLNHKCGNKEPERLISSPGASDVSDETYHEDERKSNYSIVEDMETKILPTTYLDELKKKKIKTETKNNLEEVDQKTPYIEDLQKRKQQVDDPEIKKQPSISYLEELQKRKSAREIRRVIRTSEPLISLPLRVTLPEQTEPEDLSMSTGLHSHSSGDSPLSRSLSTPEREEDEYDLDDAASLYLLQRTRMS